MEASNLHTAASYVNNLLLARGLLRSGKPVEFAQLATLVPKGESKKPSFPAPVIVADIINLVHDLILKRDRDSDHHESLTSTLRSLRAEQIRNHSELDRLRDRNVDLHRQLAAAKSAQRAAENIAKRAEATARQLRDELTKAKRTVEQIRTQCVNDIRKRDLQLSKFKSHLDQRSQQRGANKGAAGGMVITITPGKTGANNASEDNERMPSVNDDQYSLQQETTGFLTQLSQELSNENDQLISLIQSAVVTLKDLQGLPHNLPQKPSRPSSNSGLLNHDDSEELVHVNDMSHETLSGDLNKVLSTLSDLLTNPNFAPVEEVHAREEEIQHLREGWERMESRWYEAMDMMQSWRKRLMDGGDTVRLEELKRGLCLGEGLNSPDRMMRKATQWSGEAQEDEDYEEIGADDDKHNESTPDADDLPAVDESLHASERPLFEAQASAASARPLFDLTDDEQQTRDEHALCETDLNAAANFHSPDRVMSRLQLSDIENSSPLPAKPHSKAADSATSRTDTLRSMTRSKPQPPKSKLPAHKAPIAKTRATQAGRASPAPDHDLTVSEKLRIAEHEARRTSSSPLNRNPSNSESPLDLKASRDGKEHLRSDRNHTSSQASRVGSLRAVEAKIKASPVKRAKIAGRPRRRKSTLSPDELEELMKGR